MKDEELFNSQILVADGTLRDIFVQNTLITDWEKVYDYIQKSDFGVSYLKNQEQEDPPISVRTIFAARDFTHTLKIGIENAFFHCYFFTVDEIEFDIDPRDFTGKDQYKIIVDFMSLLNQLTAKRVILKCEGDGKDALPLYSVG